VLSEGLFCNIYLHKLDLFMETQMKDSRSLDTRRTMIKYVRYGDEFLIGLTGEKERCVTLKDDLKRFL